MAKSSSLSSPTKWIIIILCLAAAGMSLWLTIEKWAGRIDTLVGCGAGSGCANVLGSKWSVVFGSVPVSVFSFLLYLAVVVSLFVRSDGARWFRLFAAFLMLGAAVWFTALQVIVMKTICPYCVTMHSLGAVLALVILVAELKIKKEVAPLVAACAAAMACVMGLAALQYFGPQPDTHRVDTDVKLPSSGANVVNDVHARGEGRLISFFDGRKSYRLNALPHLGKDDAPKVIVKYFDYTCAACRDVHGDLEKLQAKYPGELTVIVLPVPLNRTCNPHLPLGVKNHHNACEFAKLSLRVWLADPGKFAEFHHWLFQYHSQPLEIAEAKAFSLVGEDKMNAVDQKDVDALLQQNVNDYKQFVKRTPVMPKLVIKGSLIMQGVTKDTATLEALFKEHLGLGSK